MRPIRKGREPSELTEWRRAASTYEDYPHKANLRSALVSEQRGLCCYCMRRISLATTRIEHREPRSKHPSLQLAYRNMLGACDGNEGRDRELQTCDVHKGSDEITIDPADPHCDATIAYLADGTIRSRDATIDADLNSTLNLNIDWLRSARTATMREYKLRLAKEHNGPWTRDVLERAIRRMEDPASGPLDPFCQTVIHELRRKLAKLA